MSGMDNVRNLTGNPLAGVDPFEVVDTRPLLKVGAYGPHAIAIQQTSCLCLVKQPTMASTGLAVSPGNDLCLCACVVVGDADSDCGRGWSGPCRPHQPATQDQHLHQLNTG